MDYKAIDYERIRLLHEIDCTPTNDIPGNPETDANYCNGLVDKSVVEAANKLLSDFKLEELQQYELIWDDGTEINRGDLHLEDDDKVTRRSNTFFFTSVDKKIEFSSTETKHHCLCQANLDGRDNY